jgi:regulator of protease activity HflC (stomatin/prohibitin superfamily)
MIAWLKSAPTTYVMQFKDGRIKREGAGLSFFYWSPTTTLVQVPLSSTDVPFAFSEVTGDFQAVTVQGQLTFRIAEPKKLAALLDFSVGRAGRYVSDDPEKLSERLVNQAQILTRAATQAMALKEALVSAPAIEARVLEELRTSEAASLLGVQVMALSILSMKPAPEMARALEAEAREALQRKSDEAIYDRRKAAVEQERRIKESELQTEVLVEEKRRHIRETKMAADIAIEQQRAELIDQTVENEKKSSDSKAYALEASLKPLRSLDWKVLSALSAGGMDPKVMIAVAFREMAENAQRIGELNMSPDLLSKLLDGPTPKNGAPAPVTQFPSRK